MTSNVTRMAEVDELDFNPFFQALQTRFLTTYENAQDNQYVICIPVTTSLRGININKHFVDTHILRRSKFFKGVYETLVSNQKTVQIEDNGKDVTLGDGFSEKGKIKIIFEELGYNKKYNPYKILIIERPLDSAYLAKSKVEDSGKEEFTPKLSLRECRQFLQSYPEFSRAIREFEESVAKFNKNYVLLKDYLDEAAHKLQTLAAATTQKCLKCSKQKLLSNPNFRDMLAISVDNYVMGNVHQKVFPVICDMLVKDDSQMESRYKQLHGVGPDQLGVSEALSCPLPSAVVELANLDALQTPMEKLYCLKNTFDRIEDDVNEHVRQTHVPEVHDCDAPCLTSDDLIPLLVTVIVKAKCRHVCSNIYYIENFHWSSPTRNASNLSYCLVTFKAAVQYMKDTNFEHLAQEGKTTKDEISIEELMEATREVTLTPKSKAVSQSDDVIIRPRGSSQSQIERQLQNISRMLEETSKEQEKAPAPRSVFGGECPRYQRTPDIVPQQDPSRKKEQLGDFLSSLQDDVFQSYGKQT